LVKVIIEIRDVVQQAEHRANKRKVEPCRPIPRAGGRVGVLAGSQRP